MVTLLLGSHRWVHRRVDTLELGAEGETRRSVSLDLTVPEALGIAGSKGRIRVPLAMVPKATLRTFDTQDPDGHPMAALGTADNSGLALDFLNQLAPDWIMSSANLRIRCLRHLQSLVNSDAENAGVAEKEFAAWVTLALEGRKKLSEPELEDLQVFRAFAIRLARSFLLIVEIDRDLAGTRVVLKYSHDQAAPEARGGTKTARFKYEVPDFGFAASQHVEVRVPSGLAVRSVLMVELAPDEETALATYRDAPGRERSVGHSALSPTTRFNSAVCRANVAPSRQGIYTFTKWAVGIVGLVVAAALAVKLHVVPDLFHQQVLTAEAKIPSQSASILLVGPALMLSWLSRNREHDLTVMLLGPLRKILMLCSLTLLLIAVAAAIPMAPLFWHVLWVLVVLVWGAGFLWLLYYCFDIRLWLRGIARKLGLLDR